MGLERERTKGVGPTRRPAGIRTFTLAALLGALGTYLGGVPVLIAAMAGVAILAALAHRQVGGDDPGLTTGIGLIAAPMLGGVAMSDPGLAAGLGATVAVIFAVKAPLHGFVTRVLTGAEVKDGLIFAIATLVIWPLLPDRYMGPQKALNPYNIWLIVVLVMALGASGHIATRALGARYGLAIAGLVAGFVSSTATIASMAVRAGKGTSSMAPAAAGAVLSTVATFVLLGLLLATVSAATLIVMAPALGVGALVASLYGLVFTFHAAAPGGEGDYASGRAFNLGTALALAIMMTVMLLIAALLRDWLGLTGLLAGAAAAGFLDAHAAAISVATLVATAKITAQEAIVPILMALTSNATAKIAVAVATGSRGFALRVVPGLILPIASVWAVALLTS